VNRSYLARIESGQPYVGLEVIGKIAEALEVEPAELLKLPLKRTCSWASAAPAKAWAPIPLLGRVSSTPLRWGRR
jgi:transcriptional regulator with XRE-family HTH domain